MISNNLKKVQGKFGKDSVWIAPYTGSLGVLEGVVGCQIAPHSRQHRFWEPHRVTILRPHAAPSHGLPT
jgi:hypothetical protein